MPKLAILILIVLTSFNKERFAKRPFFIFGENRLIIEDRFIILKDPADSIISSYVLNSNCETAIRLDQSTIYLNTNKLGYTFTVRNKLKLVSKRKLQDNVQNWERFLSFDYMGDSLLIKAKGINAEVVGYSAAKEKQIMLSFANPDSRAYKPTQPPQQVYDFERKTVIFNLSDPTTCLVVDLATSRFTNLVIEHKADIGEVSFVNWYYDYSSNTLFCSVTSINSKTRLFMFPEGLPSITNLRKRKQGTSMLPSQTWKEEGVKSASVPSTPLEIQNGKIFFGEGTANLSGFF